MALTTSEIAIVLKAYDQASATIHQVEASTNNLGSAFGKVTQNALGVAAGIAAIAGAGSAIQALGGVVVGFNAKMETSAASWKTFTGSAEAASAVLIQVQQIAATTPFEFEDVDKAAKRFVNAGMSAQGALDYVLPLANAVASVGLGAQGVDRVSLALSQMTQKGKVSGQEMLQLTEAQIPAWEILAQATGKPIPELQKLVEQGKITAKQYTDAFATFYGETGKFANAAKDQSLTFAGSMSTIRDQLNIVGSTAFQPIFKVLSDVARGFAAFVQSDTFTIWGARVQAVVGLVVEGLGSLYGAFASSLGGVLELVSTVGQAIYGALQWLNPFAEHSEPLVSQVQNGVAAIKASYSSLDSVSGTFDTVRTSFESLSGVTAKFTSEFGDDLPTKVEHALAIMGPGAVSAFMAAKESIDAAKVSVGEIKDEWDAATIALVPLKDALDGAKDSLKDQQNTLSDLRSTLADAKASYDPLNEQLKEVQRNAKDAEQAIKDLTTAPLAGSAEFEKKISGANIAIKEQSLSLGQVKNSTAYQSLGDQIDSAAAKLKEMQRTQATFIPGLAAGASDSQKKAHAEAVERNRVLADQSRTAISQQQAALDVLKDKQKDLLDPAQKELEKRRELLATIQLEKDATIGVAQERIKSAAAGALGIKEQTEAQITAAIEAARIARESALGQAANLAPQVAAQENAIKGIEGAIRAQDKAVSDAQKTVDSANVTYSDAKQLVDDLGTAYRSGKSEIAGYDQQLKQLIQTGELQVQKADEAKKAADKLAKSGSGAVTEKVDVLKGLDIEGSLKKIQDFKDNVAKFRADVESTLAPVGQAFATVGRAFSTLGTLLSAGRAVLSGIGVDFGRLSGFIEPVARVLLGFGLVLGGLVIGLKAWGLAVSVVSPALSVLGTALSFLLSPLGAVALAVTGLVLAFTHDLGGIRTAVESAFAPLMPILSRFGIVLQRVLAGDLPGAFNMFKAILTALGPTLSIALSKIARNILDFVSSNVPKIAMALAGWGSAFLGWIGPRILPMLVEIGKLKDRLLGWIGEQSLKLLAKVGEWGTAFTAWVVPQIDPMLIEAGKLKDALLAWIGEQAGKLGEKLGEWGRNFSSWVSENTQPMLDELGKLKDRLFGWVGEQSAKLGEKLKEWGEKFSKWVSENTQPMLDEAGKLKDRLFTWIGEQKTALGDKLKEWGGKFSTWVNENVDPMLSELGKLTDRLIKWIGEQPKLIGDKLNEWGQKFIGWVGEDHDPMFKQLDRIKKAVLDWIGDRTKDFGDKLKEWAGKFSTWVGDNWPAVRTELEELKTKIWNWIKEQTGGFATNLEEWAKPFITWISDTAVPKLGELKDALGGKLKEAADWWRTDGWPKLQEAGAAFSLWITDTAIPRLGDLTAALGGKLQEGLTWFRDEAWPKIQTAAAAFADWIKTELIPRLQTLVAKINDDLLPALGKLANDKQVGFPAVTKAAQDFATAIGPATKAYMDDFWAKLGEFKTFDTLASAWQHVVNVGDHWLNLLKGIAPGAAVAGAAIGQVVGDALSAKSMAALVDDLAKALDLLASIADAATTPIDNTGKALQEMWKWLNNLREAIPAWMNDPPWSHWTFPSLPDWMKDKNGGQPPPPPGGAGGGGGFGGATTPGGMSLSLTGLAGQLEAHTRAAAAVRGIDPSVASRVFGAESVGFTQFEGDRGFPGGPPSSFGPAQLHKGGIAGGGNAVGGLGDTFEQMTGLNVTDPANFIKEIDFALDYAAKHGWSAWHAAAAVGIQDWQGIGVAAKQIAPVIEESGELFTDLQLPVQQFGQTMSRLPVDVQSGGDALDWLATQTGNARGSYLEMAVGAKDSFAATVDAAAMFANQFGITLAQADDIIRDHGAVAKAVLGTDIPGSFVLTDLAVERFASEFGIHWDEARAILASSGEMSDLVMGKQIPAAVQVSVEAVASLGDKNLWKTIDGNAAIAAKSLKAYIRDSGVLSINTATASLDELRKASGLTFLQIQTQVQASGKDVKTWLLETGVPAAQAFAVSLGLVGTDADGAVPSINAVNGAVDGLSKTFLTGNPAIDSFSAALAKIPDQAKAAAQSYRDLVTAMDNNQASSGPGGSLRQAASEAADIGVHSVQAASGLISTLAKSYAQMSDAEKEAANRFSQAYPSGLSGGGSSSSGGGGSSSSSSSGSGNASPFPGHIGESGPGGKYNDPSTGKPYTRARGGPVKANWPYLIGEEGPEIFESAVAGSIVPNGDLNKFLAKALGGATGRQQTPADYIKQVSDLLTKLPRSVPVQIRATVTASGLPAFLDQLGALPSSQTVAITADSSEASPVIARLRAALGTIPDALEVGLSAVANVAPIQNWMARLRQIPRSVSVAIAAQADMRAAMGALATLDDLPESTTVAIRAEARGVAGPVNTAMAQFNRLPDFVRVPVSVEPGQSNAVLSHLQDTIDAVPPSVETMLGVDMGSSQRLINQFTASLNRLPSSESVRVVLNTAAAERDLASLQDQIAEPVTKVGPGIDMTMVAPQRGAAPSSGTGGGMSRDDARMIAQELARAMLGMPAPRVDLEEVRSGLARIGSRNSGYVGLA